VSFECVHNAHAHHLPTTQSRACIPVTVCEQIRV
jgi:hypothetical protein